MNSFDITGKSKTGPEQQRSRAVLLCWAMVIAAALSPEAKGAFIGDYALSNFTLTNTNANGSAVVNTNGALVFTGGNNGSGLRGTTDLTTFAVAPGVVSFTYSYSSLDSPTFDFAGYLLSSTFIQLADATGQSGTITFPVSLRQAFGFRVGTADNTGEPGVLTVSNFNAPSSAVPEPSTVLLVPAAIAGILAAQKRRRLSGQSTKERT